MKKRKYAILWTVCGFILLGVLLSFLYAREQLNQGYTKPKNNGPRRSEMRTIETGNDYFIMLDPETGCCYLFSASGGVCQLTKNDGSPYLANGWRDIG